VNFHTTFIQEYERCIICTIYYGFRTHLFTSITRAELSKYKSR